MKFFGKVISFTLLAINAFFACTLILTAYSPYIHPRAHSIESCMGLTFPIFLLINVLFLIFWLIVHYKFALFPLLVLILCFPQISLYMPINFQTNKLPDGTLKILSYNVMGFNHLKSEGDHNPILNYIKNSDADIVCLQEYNVATNPKYLTEKKILKAMSDYPYHDVVKVGNKSSGNNMALFSKYPILSARKIDYPTQYNGSAIYEIVVGKDTVTLINNHLESNKLTAEDKATFGDMLKDPDAHKMKSGTLHLVKKLAEASAIRSTQADSVASAIAQSPHETIIVCGDFNDTPISYAHRVIGENLNDAFKQSGNGLGISYNQNKFYFRIDHILTSKNITTYNSSVDRSIKDSDHYPIMTHIKINQ